MFHTHQNGCSHESSNDLYVQTFFTLILLLGDGFLTPQGKLRHSIAGFALSYSFKYLPVLPSQP